MDERADRKYTGRSTYEEFLKISAGEGPDELIGGYVYRGDMLLDIPNQGHITAEEFEKIRSVGWEFIDGEIIKMEAPSIAHQKISLNIAIQISMYLRGKKCEVLQDVDVQLGTDDYGDPITVRSDISVVCDPDKLKGRDCQGAPDMVVEIFSPTTRRKDMLQKLRWYKRCGVREYWMVDPESQVVQVIIFEDGKDNYMTYGRDEKIKVHVLEDCEIDLNEVFTEA